MVCCSSNRWWFSNSDYSKNLFYYLSRVTDPWTSHSSFTVSYFINYILSGSVNVKFVILSRPVDLNPGVDEGLKPFAKAKRSPEPRGPTRLARWTFGQASGSSGPAATRAAGTPRPQGPRGPPLFNFSSRWQLPACMPGLAPRPALSFNLNLLLNYLII